MKIVAVTACPTGIAHSQMAAENLKTAAESRGHEIHVEVQGAMGTQDELPADAIDAADVAVITADTAVSEERFDGIPVVKRTVKAGVNDAEGVVREAEERVDVGADVTADPTEESGPSDGSEDASPKARNPDAATADSSRDTDDADRSSGGLLAGLKRRLS
ncbi:PTS fructose transporter subunit IIB [Salinigranum sp. GCM10025319]|uniref:PTS fructose transporter subunit IIB n=1 Tax=Salinigranum sp. GCM10025319 TaxID=3252687 RepID=UPI003618C1FA